MAYVYRHIRIDKNEPFYIGIGADDKYARANEAKGRNPHWHNIVNKTEYYVEIIMDELTWEAACLKEIEFISIYGRVKDGGTLCNITKGGDGKLGVRPANAFPKGHTPWMKGRKLSKEQHENMIGKLRGKPSWNRGVAPSQETIDKQMETKIREGKILKGEKHPMFGKTHSDEQKELWRITRKGILPPNTGLKWGDGIVVTEKMLNAQKGRCQKIYQYDLNDNLVSIYESMFEAQQKTGVRRGNISHCVKGNRKSSGGFRWLTQPLDNHHPMSVTS